MNFIGDYFAIGLAIVLGLFFFDQKIKLREMPSASRVFLIGLICTVLTALTDLFTGQLLILENVPLWQNVLLNSLYFVVNIATTTCIAFYMFMRILEHGDKHHCMRNACIANIALIIVYLGFVIANLWNGWLFYFDDAGSYCRGPLNVLGYLVTLVQLVLVGICYMRNRQFASRPMRRVLTQFFPIIPLCIIIQRACPEIMLNGFLLAMAETVIFLAFQGKRQGIHSLTELNDRRRFFTEVDRRIQKKEPFQIFLINIKNFGAINQKHGHVFGDEYLYKFAFALEKLAKGKMAFHMNGTVFAIIVRYTCQNAAERLSEELLEFMENGVNCMDQHVVSDYVLVHYISDGQESSSVELYENMEYSCNKSYNQKQRYIRCTSEVREEMTRRRYLRERIKQVDSLHGFEVWFQPIQCLSTGVFCSMEALIRLREQDGTLVSPGEFIPMAEQTGQIASVTWFVLEEVCRALKYNQELQHVSVSINLPMTQLLDKSFVPKFVSIVNQYGIDHRKVCIEFTERAILDNFRETQYVMEELVHEGFRFFLDDFGAGYSNFNCLLQLPFQIIKLDSCLTHYRIDGQTDYSMVKTLTKLFHDRGLVVIAEGAETEEEVKALAEVGVDRVQGFALAKPMPEEELLKFYRNHSGD